MTNVATVQGEPSFDMSLGILRIPTKVRLTFASGTPQTRYMNQRTLFEVSQAISEHYATDPTAKFKHEDEILRSARGIVAKVLAQLPTDADADEHFGLEPTVLTLHVSQLPSKLEDIYRASDLADERAEYSQVAFDTIIEAVADQLKEASSDETPQIASRLGASVSSIENKVFKDLTTWLLENPSDMPDPKDLTVEATFSIENADTMSGEVLVTDTENQRHKTAFFKVEL